MVDNSGKLLYKIRPGRIIIPIIIGIAVSGFLLRDFDFSRLSSLSFTPLSIFFIAAAFGLMGVRDLGYIWRLRILSENDLSWRKCLNVIMLWEFTSAITPSAVGGTSVAIFFINKEGIKIGKSSAIVMMTSLLDELYFILTFPIILLIVGFTDAFSFGEFVQNSPWYLNQFFLIAMGGYSIKLIYTLILSYGMFINPRGLKWLLLFIFKLPIIRKWRPQANDSGDDLLKASIQFKNWPKKKWGKAILATSISWTARYLVVNALILFLFDLSFFSISQHLLIFSKQLIMWVMMLITPTPGGSGFAEYIFKAFLAGNLPIGMESFVAFLWRIISYYPYLIIGSILIPKWIKKHFIQSK